MLLGVAGDAVGIWVHAHSSSLYLFLLLSLVSSSTPPCKGQLLPQLLLAAKLT